MAIGSGILIATFIAPASIPAPPAWRQPPAPAPRPACTGSRRTPRTRRRPPPPPPAPGAGTHARLRLAEHATLGRPPRVVLHVAEVGPCPCPLAPFAVHGFLHAARGTRTHRPAPRSTGRPTRISSKRSSRGGRPAAARRGPCTGRASGQRAWT